MSLVNSMSTLMESEKYSDLVITCEGRHFNVHKAVMCSASSVIAAACDSKMKESETGIIDHTVFDAETVQRMISYVYKREYDIPTEIQVTVPACSQASDTGDTDEGLIISGVNATLIAHARMYGIREYYDLPTLKSMARERFAATDTLELEVDSFISVIQQVYKCSIEDDCELRRALRTIAHNHILELTRDDLFMINLAALDTVQDFAADMLRQMVGHHLELQNEIRLAEAREESVTDKLEHTEQVMESLVASVESLPSQCGNGRCDREFGQLDLERKGHPRRGAGQGNWVVRCGRCRCKLSQ